MSTADADVSYRPRSLPYRNRAAWLEARKPFIGASEIAALFDLSSYMTARQLYHLKRGELPEEDLSGDVRVLCGEEQESANARIFSRLHGIKLVKSRRLLADDARRMCASLDYELIVKGVGRVPVELKAVDSLVWSREAMTDGVTLRHDAIMEDVEPPLHHDLQVQHQMSVTGAPYALYGAVVGGNRPFLIRRPRHEGVIAEIRKRVTAFWARVEENDPPDLISADDAVMKAIHREGREDAARDLRGDPTFVDLCQAYKSAGADEKAAKERKELAAASLREMLGNHDSAFGDGYRVRWPAKTRAADEIVTSVRKAGPYRGALTVTAVKAKKEAA